MRWYVRYYADGGYFLHTSYSEAEHMAFWESLVAEGRVDHRTHSWVEE